MVSVIIPFYNVSPFIERCAYSLMEQTYQDVEFIFVDDASPDESRHILEQVIRRFPERDVKILSHAVNKGLPAARNTGLQQAKGEYIYHCDSDDWLETDMLEKMIETAVSRNADFVYCDFLLESNNGTHYMGNPSFTDPEEMIKVGFLAGLMKYNVWNKLVSRALYDTLFFPEGHGMGEDMTMILVAMRAKQTAHLAEGLYHYNKLNANAFSNTFSERHLIDIKFNTSRTLQVLQEWPVSDTDVYAHFFKLNIKLPFLFSQDKNQYKLWEEWFPESNPYILKNKYLPFRTRIIQWVAAKGLFGIVNLYVQFVNRIYYRWLRS